MNKVITVSRELGSLGSYIGAGIAKKLKLRYLDREILHRAAEMAGYPDELMVTHLETREDVPGALGRILDALAAIPPVPTIPSATLREQYTFNDMVTSLMLRENISYNEAMERLQAEYQRAEAATGYAELIQRVILEYAQSGNAVIAGRGGQIILKDMPSILHIQIIASESVRSRRIAKRMGIELPAATQTVREDDKKRARYMKHFHNADWRNPELYDIVLNTDKLSVPMAIDIVCRALQGFTESPQPEI